MVESSNEIRLPKHSKEFQSSEYWQKFFEENAKKSENQSFEWYADFVDME